MVRPYSTILVPSKCVWAQKMDRPGTGSCGLFPWRARGRDRPPFGVALAGDAPPFTALESLSAPLATARRPTVSPIKKPASQKRKAGESSTRKSNRRDYFELSSGRNSIISEVVLAMLRAASSCNRSKVPAPPTSSAALRLPIPSASRSFQPFFNRKERI